MIVMPPPPLLSGPLDNALLFILSFIGYDEDRTVFLQFVA